MNTKLKHLLSITVVALFLVMAIASGDDKKNDGKTSTNTENAPKADEPKSNWNYSESKDEMSGEAQFFNTTTSTNEIEFKFPYSGGSTFDLTVRNMGNGNEVLLSVSKGQFLTSIMGSQACRFKFDDEPPLTIVYNSAQGAKMDVIFFDDAKKIISKLKTAKKLKLEAPFYDAGNQIIEFNVDGFTWAK